MLRFTKIVATIGPATADENIIKSLILAGANVFRFNIKHNTTEWHQAHINLSKNIAQDLGKTLSILIDVPKPEMAAPFKDVDFVALSYITTADEVTHFKNTCPISPLPKIVAKIENKTALINMESIINVADAVMIARGDLATDIPFEHLAFWQKKIITSCRLNSTPVIVATQMLQSMVRNPTPTRAEATDVANAVFDGTDALMLSEETALGKYPVDSVKQMDSIASFCDNQGEIKIITTNPKNISQLLVKSAANLITQSRDIKAAIVFTQSGSSVRQLSAYRLQIPIIAITNDNHILAHLHLSRGVFPLLALTQSGNFQIEDAIFRQLLSFPFLKAGDTVLIIHGNNWFNSGSTSDISLKTL